MHFVFFPYYLINMNIGRPVKYLLFLDIHASVHHVITYENYQKMQLCRIIYYSLAALHVSSGIFAHHQEHLNCITASGITHVCCCRLPAGSDIRM